MGLSRAGAGLWGQDGGWTSDAVCGTRGARLQAGASLQCRGVQSAGETLRATRRCKKSSAYQMTRHPLPCSGCHRSAAPGACASLHVAGSEGAAGQRMRSGMGSTAAHPATGLYLASPQHAKPCTHADRPTHLRQICCLHCLPHCPTPPTCAKVAAALLRHAARPAGQAKVSHLQIQTKGAIRAKPITNASDPGQA